MNNTLIYSAGGGGNCGSAVKVVLITISYGLLGKPIMTEQPHERPNYVRERVGGWHCIAPGIRRKVYFTVSDVSQKTIFSLHIVSLTRSLHFTCVSWGFFIASEMSHGQV